MASSRRERIEQLIRQEEDPEGTMLWLKEKLWEPGVCHGLDTSSPRRLWFDFCARFCSQRHFFSAHISLKVNDLSCLAILCIVAMHPQPSAVPCADRLALNRSMGDTS